MAVVVVFMASSLGLMTAVTAKLFLGISLLTALAVWSSVGTVCAVIGIAFILMMQNRAAPVSTAEDAHSF